MAAIINDDVGTFLRQANRNPLTNALAAARDQCDFSGEFHGDFSRIPFFLRPSRPIDSLYSLTRRMKRSILSTITILLAVAFLGACANKNEEMIVMVER